MSRFAMSTRAVTGRYHDKSIIGQQWNAHDVDRWLNHVYADDDPACDDMPEVQAWAVDADQDGWAPCGAPNCGELCHAEKWLYGDHAHCDGVCREESIVADEIYADSQEVQELVLSIEEDASYEPVTARAAIVIMA